MEDHINHGADDVSQQGLDGVKDAGRKLASPVKRAGQAAVSKAKTELIKSTGKAVKAAGKAVAGAVKALIAALPEIGGVLLIVLAVILVVILIVGCAHVFLLEERGTNESNNLNPVYQNPSYMTETGVTKAIAMTEPQAVVDAYYKFMSTSSYIKSYQGKLYEFQTPEETQDFAALRDYNRIEENFFLSDDFIRSIDEMLHHDDFYFPEQIVKPVYGQKMELVNGTDADGSEITGEYYTARLPFDTPDGESMLDGEIVKDFDKLLASGFTMTADFAAIDGKKQLLAQSQVPEATAEEGYFRLKERNVINGTSGVTTESGLWDYGFASVLEYQPDQKISYIECSYDAIDVDFDVSCYDEEEEEWSDYTHSQVISMPAAASLDAFLAACSAKCEEMEDDNTRYTYSVPSNINALLDDTAVWNMSVEPNSAAEATYKSFYSRDVTNQHIDAKITSAWDADIDRLQFNDEALQDAYGNIGGGLYPINIAVCSHAATFSGNLHCQIIPAGEDGCARDETSLAVNTTAVSDHRQPVQTIAVAGGCDGVTLTAHRTGSVITLTPKIEEAGAPWGFEYLQEYAEYYHCYAPRDYINDREFMVRTGLNAGDATEDHEKYLQNLNYLMSLGLLRLYSGNISLSAVGSVDLSAMGDTESDLYILSHVIAAEAGPNKLDELMVGCVFVNRVASGLFPNTFKGVLTSGAYACYSDGNYQKANPTDSEIASAVQVLTGQFAIPDNIFGQSASIQGAIYKTVVNGAGLNTHYYCAMPAGVAVSTVDRFGRPAPDAEQLDALADALSGATSAQAGASASSINYPATAFIGDSLMDGLDITHALSGQGAAVLTESYATIAHMTDLVNASGSLHEGISTVYMLIGTQSSSLNDSDFRTQYTQLLAAVREKSPYANIILIALPPVVDGVSSYSNTYINQKNAIISDIASSNGYPIIDINTPLLDGGQLNSAYSSDGTNLNSAAYDILFSKIQSGLTSSTIGTDVSDAYSFYDQNGLSIYSRYTLYDISEYDVITATNMQARVVQAETGIIATLKALLGGVVDFVTDTLEGFVDFFNQFLYATQEAITGRNLDRSEDVCYRYGAPYNGYDVKSVVYHSIAFSTQTWFSTAQSAADEMAESENGLMFLFVGKASSLGLGTIGGGSMLTAIPGVGASVSGMISPTSTYYPPLQGYNPSALFMKNADFNALI